MFDFLKLVFSKTFFTIYLFEFDPFLQAFMKDFFPLAWHVFLMFILLYMYWNLWFSKDDLFSFH
jgi:hypothetical protein